MEFGLLLVLFGIFILIAFLVQAVSLNRSKKLAAYAKSLGWDFHPEKDRTMSGRYPEFKCLRQGHSQYAHNRMSGRRDGREVIAFDYRYVTGHGKNRRIHHFSALIVKSPLPLKPLSIRPENIFDRVADFFGFDDIDFESAEFSREFFVKSAEKRWAYDVVHPRMMAYLLEAPRFNLEFDQSSIISWLRKRFREDDFEKAFSIVQGVFDRLPEYLSNQMMDTFGPPGG